MIVEDSKLSVKQTSWNYQTSVEKVKSLTYKWKNLSVEIVRELYSARIELDSRGHNKGKENVTNVTFSKYLEDCNLERMTVHRWLERYIAEEDKLLTTEEYQERKEIEDRAKMSEHIAIREMVIHRHTTGKEPKDWNEKAERAYKRYLQEQKERSENISKYKEELQEKAKQQEKKKEEFENLKKETDDLFKQATGRLIESHQKRSDFKDKIRLSADGKKDIFVDAIMDYLETLETDNRRIEACYNIIKVCKNIAVQLQQK